MKNYSIIISIFSSMLCLCSISVHAQTNTPENDSTDFNRKSMKATLIQVTDFEEFDIEDLKALDSEVLNFPTQDMSIREVEESVNSSIENKLEKRTLQTSADTTATTKNQDLTTRMKLPKTNTAGQFYIVVNNKPIHIGTKKSKLIATLGDAHHIGSNADSGSKKPANDDTVLIWVYKNGLTLMATFDSVNQLLREATISGSGDYQNSYAVVYGKANYLNTASIIDLEASYNETHRCLSFSEEGGIGWMDYAIRDSDSLDNYLIFSAVNSSLVSLNTLEGIVRNKSMKVDSMTLRAGRENYSKNIYCKKWFE